MRQPAFWLRPSNGKVGGLSSFPGNEAPPEPYEHFELIRQAQHLGGSQDESTLVGLIALKILKILEGSVFLSKHPGSRERAKQFVDNNRDKVPYCRKDYWCAEAYARVTFLIGMMHLIQSFAYWLPIHNIGELGLVWGAVVCASSLSAAVWIMFRMDVLPSHGGVFPIEIGGPIIEAISLALAYTHHPTAGVLDISRTLV